MWVLVAAAAAGVAGRLAGVRTRRGALEVHLHRRRRIAGCVACGREVLPDSLDQGLAATLWHLVRPVWAGSGSGTALYACTECPSEMTFCAACIGAAARARAAHQPLPRCLEADHHLTPEPLFLEVDSSGLAEAATVVEVLVSAFSLYRNRPCLGHRPSPATNRDFQWLTYGEVLEQCLGVVAFFRQHGLVDGDFVLLCGEVSVDWYVAQYACFLAGLACVPLPPAQATGPTLAFLQEAVKPRCIITSAHSIVAIEQAWALPCLFLLLDDSADWYFRPTAASGPQRHKSAPKHHRLSGLTDRADARTLVEAADRHPDPNRISMLLPSSGSTGRPKLVIITQAMLLRQCRPSSQASLTVLYTFVPLRQSLDLLANGGRIACASSLEALWEEVRVARPTVFGGTPRLWHGQFQEYLAEVQSRCAAAGRDGQPVAAVEQEVLREWKAKAIVGSRCQQIVVGGAASPQRLLDWLWEVGTFTHDGYGCTETGGLALDGVVNGGTRLHLVDCPELGYTTADTPHPRGEIVAHSNRLSPGYFGDEAVTAASFVTIAGRRYFRTGDIGELVGGKIRIIDRRKVLVKLSNGLFVSPTAVEQVLSRSPLVQHLCVVGRPSWRAVAAIVAPTPGAARAHPLPDALCAALWLQFSHLGRDHALQPYEVPSHILLVDAGDWTIAAGLVTPSGKLCRPGVQRRYRSRLDRLVPDGLDPGPPLPPPQQPAPPGPTSANHGSFLCAGLREILRASIPGLDLASVQPTTLLYDLGVDSLTIVAMARQIAQRFSVNLPLRGLAAARTLIGLQELIFCPRAPRDGGIDGNVETGGSAGEALLARELAALAAARCDRGAARGEAADEAEAGGAILLTGASGFVGVYLLRELRRRAPERPVVCLVRAATASDGERRLRSTLEYYGLWAPGVLDRVTVVAGNLTSHRLGLGAEQWEGLARQCGTVVHCGARVNGLLPLAPLAESNVGGTRRVIQLCLAAGADLHFVSSVSALAGTGVLGEMDDVPLPAADATTGYGLSKWVAERLVFEAAERYGLCARVLRLGTIGASAAPPVVANPKDAVTALLAGALREGVICVAPELGSCPLPATLFLAPVDWAAQAIVAACLLRPSPGPAEVIHVLNRHPTTLADVTRALSTAGTVLRELPAADFRAVVQEWCTDEDHPWFFYRDTLLGAGYASGGESPDDARLRRIHPACPPTTAAYLRALLLSEPTGS